MIKSETFVTAGLRAGFKLYAGVPCSYLKPFINHVIDNPNIQYVGAANEGDAIAIAAGAEIGGYRAVAMFQNSGLGNAVNPLSSLTHTAKIPILIITTLRGDPNGEKDEPQHDLMGAITTPMLEMLDIPWEYFPTKEEDIEAVLNQATKHMDKFQRPFAFVMKKGTVESWPLNSTPKQKVNFSHNRIYQTQPNGLTRHDVLSTIQNSVDPELCVLVATTGFTGRELFACGDLENQLYMVGSMGCAASLSLGLAITQPQKKVICIDGDGALLMRMGALSTVGYERPKNLVHVLLDNEKHESTGGQSTVSHSVNFCNIAAACGYAATLSTNSLAEIESTIKNSEALTFIHVKTEPGTIKPLPRPNISPAALAARLKAHLKG